MRPSIGRDVHYTLTEQDAERINQRRDECMNRPTTTGLPNGNRARAGEIVSLKIVRVWTETCVNGQALLDGDDSLWVTSASLDDAGKPGTWRWPPRVD